MPTLIKGTPHVSSPHPPTGETDQVLVDLLLAGHLHRGYHGDIRTHHAAIKRSILVAQASTATSTRLRNEPNAYNVIEIDGDRVGFGGRVWDGSLFRYRASGRFVRREGHWMKD